MARAHALILTSIWEDEEFLRLHPLPQRLYLFLLSQANLSRAGLLPLTLKRWASKGAGLAVADLEEQLAVLEAARFIVMDSGSEELLIRTMLKGDGIYRQPNIMASAVSAAMELSSLKLRRALLIEAQRLPLAELSDEPSAKGGPSVRAQIRTHVDQLRAVLRVPEEPDSAPVTPGVPLQDPSGNPSAPPQTPAEPIADPTGNPSGNPSGTLPTRAHAPARVRTSPTPSPTPTYKTAGSPEDEQQPLVVVAVADAAPPPGTTNSPATGRHQVADALTAAFWEHHKQRTAQSFIAIRGIVRTALGNGLDRDMVARALDHLATEGRAISGGTITTAIGQLQQPVQGAFLTALPGGRPNTTDQRVADGYALAARLEAQEKHA